MRHLGAGLAIPTFPAANPQGGLLPAVHNFATDINFAHTRVGAALIGLLIAILAFRALAAGRADPRIVRPAALALALVVAQVTMGILVIWNLRPQLLTSLHVVNGAALLATIVLLSLRAGRARRLAAGDARGNAVATRVEVAV
jgi:cytochrome c oxidase assembly protein subunit 15